MEIRLSVPSDCLVACNNEKLASRIVKEKE
nr:MAG TPA: hypothetical protein [Caudoviricetes sp.]